MTGTRVGTTAAFAPVRGDRHVDRVGAVTVFEVEGSPRLELPDEPIDLQRELRDTLLSGANWREGFSDDICIGLLLWRAWRPALEPLGFSREDFIDSVVAYRRELWLWLMGDRGWIPYVTGLAARVIRRVPTAAL